MGSVIAASYSLSLGWTLSQNGYEMGVYWYFFAFIYPLYIAIKKTVMSKTIGLSGCAVPITFATLLIYNAKAHQMMGYGPHVFIFAFTLLALGILMYREEE